MTDASARPSATSPGAPFASGFVEGCAAGPSGGIAAARVVVASFALLDRLSR